MSKCASCHGKPSEGRSSRATFFKPPAPDFTNAHYRNVDPAYLSRAEIFSGVIRTAGAAGNLVHDAHIAALCLEHGVSELITGDRDFSRFPDLRIVHPFS